ncbi:sigma-70 family RNA polymerase sigma factor [Demequina lignilytica]|uniref:Sigma-70 family RNA polymerase sigma factor n=1 Tax=Demequina lignilytica TaxID=3051663 RepID=A0AB35MJ13_9MICO|nr:sigma-70 family RNA polymerase sigma factor [Demequina sp. SYSU T0a273]MDN4483771.1 sigma-70 family RNA polymerase sigma factor [Demequina sp. SYSU T0a273]
MNRWQGVLDTMIRERRGALVGYAYLLAGDRPTAEDLVHDAIIRTFTRARRLDDPRSAEAYVRRTIATQFLNGRRSRAVARAKQHLLVERDAPPADQTAGENAEVTRALGLLTRRQRACVVLRHFEDLSTEETAERLGISPGSVKRYLHDALAVLREELRGLDDSDEREDAGVRVVAPRGVRR